MKIIENKKIIEMMHHILQYVLKYNHIKTILNGFNIFLSNDNKVTTIDKFNSAQSIIHKRLIKHEKALITARKYYKELDYCIIFCVCFFFCLFLFFLCLQSKTIKK